MVVLAGSARVTVGGSRARARGRSAPAHPARAGTRHHGRLRGRPLPLRPPQAGSAHARFPRSPGGMKSAEQVIAIALPFAWLGLVLGISVIETPLKFRAPGITLPLGLGIGRLVFRALNRVELVIAVVLTAVVAHRARDWPLALAAAIAALAPGAGRLPAAPPRPQGGAHHRGRGAPGVLAAPRLHRTGVRQGHRPPGARRLARVSVARVTARRERTAAHPPRARERRGGALRAGARDRCGPARERGAADARGARRRGRRRSRAPPSGGTRKAAAPVPPGRRRRRAVPGAPAAAARSAAGGRALGGCAPTPPAWRTASPRPVLLRVRRVRRWPRR